MLGGLLPDLFRDRLCAVVESRGRLGERKRRALRIGVIGSLSPRSDCNDSLVLFADLLERSGVQVQAHAAAIDLVGTVQLLALAGVLMLFGQVSAVLFAAHALLPQMFAIGLGSVLLRIALLIVFIGRLGLYGAAIAAAIAICLEVRLDVFPEVLHSFQMMAGHAPEADDAIARLAEWVRPKLGLAQGRQQPGR
jgi:hypothetical protein